MPGATSPDAAPIYRGMDRATLDAAYNNSAAVADSAEWLARWRGRSASVRAMRGARLDVPYGSRERQKIDYLPAGRRAAPLLVFIHGGYWQRNAKEMFAFVAEGPLAHGINVALLGYTLAPVARLTDIVEEMRQALSFLTSSADEFGFDRDSIHVGGWSAGGHLAGLACREPAVRSALAISGIFDLEPIALTYLDEQLHLDRNEIESLSPARVLRTGMAPLHLSVGDAETSELRRQSMSFKEIADGLGLPVTLRTLPGHHHFSIVEELAQPDGALTRELVRVVSGTTRR
jgi:arylformamidase